ncbi:MAG: hypothetical protein ACYDIE_03510 [Candidatus Krumholzibacteriia bacterium]
MNRQSTDRRRGLASGLVIAAALVGCSSSTAPGFQTEVGNATDNFQTLGGTPGTWTIEVVLERVAAAAINFRVQKAV